MLRRLAAVALLLAACGSPDTAAESLPVMTLTPEAPAPSTTYRPPAPSSTAAATTTTTPQPPVTVLLVDPTRLTVAPEVWGG